MKKRFVTITIDSLVAMFRDYLPEGDIQESSKPIKMMLNQQERKIAIVVEGPDIPSGASPMGMKFMVKRLHGVTS